MRCGAIGAAQRGEQLQLSRSSGRSADFHLDDGEAGGDLGLDLAQQSIRCVHPNQAMRGETGLTAAKGVSQRNVTAAGGEIAQGGVEAKGKGGEVREVGGCGHVAGIDDPAHGGGFFGEVRAVVAAEGGNGATLAPADAGRIFGVPGTQKEDAPLRERTA